jgi:excisionase family DNA binding protein
MSEALTNGSTDPKNERLTFTVDEVARLLGISRSGAYDSIARGEIPSLNIGRRVLVPREPFLELVRCARRRRRPDDPWGRGRL